MYGVLTPEKLGARHGAKFATLFDLAASSPLQLPMAGLLATLPPYATSLISNGLLFLLIGGMAGSCDAPLLKAKFTTAAGFRGILAGLVCQFVLLPLLGFIALKFLPQSPPSAIALLVVTTSPGGGFSGFWCYTANADLALSVAMTTASTLVAVVALPLNLALYITTLYGRTCTIDFANLVLACAVVVCAVICGYQLSLHFPQARNIVSALGQTAGVLLMIFGALANGSSHEPVWENSPDWFGAVCLPVLGGLGIAMCLALLIRLPSPQAVAVAIECCYQNTGLALTIALSAMPKEDVGEASGVPIVYGMFEILVIPVFALAAWRLGWTYAPANTNVCVAIAGNFQPTQESLLDSKQEALLDNKKSSGSNSPRPKTTGLKAIEKKAMV